MGSTVALLVKKTKKMISNCVYCETKCIYYEIKCIYYEIKCIYAKVVLNFDMYSGVC